MNENTTNQTAGTQTPVDGYVRSLIADLKAPTPKNRWEELPPAEGRTKSQYRLQDADGNIATLTCDTEKKSHSQYTLRVTDAEERPLMRSMEWQAAGCPSELGTLYALLQNRCHAVEPEKVEHNGGYVTPEQTDCFIRALVRDAKMPRPKLSWKREHHDDKVGYYSSGLSKSGSSIWLQQDHEDETSDSYTLQYVRDGEMILSCTETASLTENPDCPLRELYHLIAKEDPKNFEVEVSAPEIRRFIAETESREMLDRICKKYKEEPLLVGDLFRQATMHRVTHQFVMAAIDQCPGLCGNPLEKCRLQRLAESAFNGIRYAKRAPHGATFSMRAFNMAFEPSGCPSRLARMSYSPQRISNAYITWREEMFADADIPLQAKINRTCVLVLMAMLKDELP
ncbi:MAG: hypothetical protein IJ365_00820 [Clostridia bacterium]|nr:hypothetical protein [Clostridia bacterium]